VKILPLIGLVAVGAFAIHGANLHWAGSPSASSMGAGCVPVFFAFMGTEGALTVSGKVINPARTVPRAILRALTIVAILYIGLQLVTQWVLGPALATSKAPLVSAALAIFGPRGERLMVATIAISVIGYLAADFLSSPRSLLALAEHGHWTGSFRVLVIAATSGTLILYLICCVGLLRLRAKRIETDGEPFRAPGGPFAPLAASAIIAWMLTTLELKELAAALVLIGASGTFYRLQRRFARIV